MRLLTYLAGPYSYWDPTVRVSRYEHLTRAAAWLMRVYEWNVFSPITHSHPLHAIGGMRGDWAFWQKIDTEFIALSARLIVLTLPGWRESVGVTAEISIARSQGIEVLYMLSRGPEKYLLSHVPDYDELILDDYDK